MENKQGLLYLTPKASYYNTKEEVVAEANNLHDHFFSEDRELYTYLLYFKNATYFSKGLIIERLLSNSLHKEENKHLVEKDPAILEIEDNLIHYTLFNESITHALKLLLSLKDKRINNTRTANVILRFLFERGNLDYISIKYKNKVKELLIHALGARTAHGIVRREDKAMKKFNKLIKKHNNPFALEVIDFVFGEEKEYESPFLSEYMTVREAFKNNNVTLDKKTNIPIEVLEGFNSFFGTNYHLPSLMQAAVISKKQKIQMQNKAKRHETEEEKIDLEIDLNDYDIVELYKHLYYTEELTEQDKEEAKSVIRSKANELRARLKEDFVMDLNNVAILLDASDSHYGSDESHLHPLYKNLLLKEIFQTEDGSNVFIVGGEEKDGLLYPSGHTDLSRGLLEIVKSGHKNIIVLSDGFENVGSFDKVYQQLKKIGYGLNVVHFNPVFSPKNFSFKEISEDVPSIPYADEKDLENLALLYLLNTDPDKFKEMIRDRIVSELLNNKGGDVQ